MTEVERQIVASLLQSLLAARIMPEHEFDALAAERYAALKLRDPAGRAKALKALILGHGRAYRLTMRGRAYLARTRLAGQIDGQWVVGAHDVGRLLERLAEMAVPEPAPKRRDYGTA